MPEPPIKHSRPLAFQPLKPNRLRSLRIAQAVGALSLFVVGGVHLEQYYVAYFSVVPTIGPLFLANFIAATVFGLVLLVPIRSGAGRLWLTLDSLVALAGIGLSVGGFAGLLVSEHTPLFGFMEHGYRLEIVLALAAETVATVSLSVFLAYVVPARIRPARSRPQRSTSSARRRRTQNRHQQLESTVSSTKQESYKMNRTKLSVALVGAVIAAVVVIIVATSGGAASTAHRSVAPASTISLGRTSLGNTLVDANGRALYLFEADKHDQSTLSAAGQAVWPPLTATAKPAAAGGVNASEITLIKGAGGSGQVAYNGHPLYYYVGDRGPGQTKGQGLNEFGALWYVLAPSGTAITSARTTPAPAPSSSGSSGYGY